MVSYRELTHYKKREKKKKIYPRDTNVEANNPACLDELRDGLLCPYPCKTQGRKRVFKNVWKWYSHLLTHRSIVPDKFETNEVFRLRKHAEVKYQKGLTENILNLIILGVIPIKGVSIK